MSISERIHLKDVRLLSNEHYKLMSVTFEWRRADGSWQTSRREVFERGQEHDLEGGQSVKDPFLAISDLKFNMKTLHQMLEAQKAHFHCTQCGCTLEQVGFCAQHGVVTFSCLGCLTSYTLRLHHRQEGVQVGVHVHETPSPPSAGAAI